MSFRSTLIPFATTAAILVLWGCGDNPTEIHVPDSGVTVAVSTTPGEIQTLSTVTFHASVMGDQGGMMMGLRSMEMEYRLEGTDTWVPVDMDSDGDEYEGTCVFTSTGNYDVRAMGMMQGSHHMDEMYHMDKPLHVGRAHVEAGGYRVEFESYPGHLHIGVGSMMRFWVLDPGAEDSWTPVSGLAPTIRVTESDGTSQSVAATETEPGIYEAPHTFNHIGHAEAALLFKGVDGSGAIAMFTMPGPDLH